MGKMFRGCGTALVTPFAEDGSVDYAAYEGIVKRQVSEGVDFLVTLATTGETPTLSAAEKRRLMTVTRECCGTLPLIAGVGSNSLEGTLENIRTVCTPELPGLPPTSVPDALLVVVPFYNKPTQEGLYLYFKAVAESSPLPVVIYNVPGRTGANILPSTVLRLAREEKKIIGVKEASGSYSQACEILLGAPEDFRVLSGDDDLTFPMMASGADGVISVASNVAPRVVSEMAKAALSGDFLKARELHLKLFPLFKACFKESNPIPVKAALALMGLCRPHPRLPLSKATEATFDLMSEVLKNLE